MAKGKLKMLYLVQVFIQDTDDDHKLTLQQIADKLSEHNIRADRKTLYQDFEELREYGLDIISEQIGHNTFYHLGERDFELPELKLLVDSVQAAKFITDRKSRELIRKLENLTSRYQAQQLQRQVYITGRVKAMNESIYYNIDRIHGAIHGDRQICFQYCQWNINREMKPRRRGQWYQVSPWSLCWDNEKYYLIAYDAGADQIKHYRVDKMQKISMIEAARQGAERFEAFDMAQYAKSVFGMFTGDETEVVLQGENHMIGVIIDRFGKDIPLSVVDEAHFEAKVSVALSPQFLGWVMALGSAVRITGPEAVVQRMREEILRLNAQYLNQG